MNKIILTLLAGTALLAVQATLAQPAQPQNQAAEAPARAPDPARFDLDFAGGTPRQLVDAVEKASGKPLNALIPDEDAGLHLPPMKMRSVSVPELFEALMASSQKTLQLPRGGTFTSMYGFKNLGNRNDTSVWYFVHSKPVIDEERKACRFYQLAECLDSYKIEDITTAIQTGWRMLGETNPPTISFHKDTKLLIAVGEPSKLQMIDSVIQQLAQGRPQPQPASKHEGSGARSAQPARQ